MFTNAEVTAKSGTFGNYRAVVHAGGESIHLEVGQIIVATGFDSYEPDAGEFGYGIDGVLTLPEWKQLLDEGDGPLGRRRQAGRERRLRLLRRQPQRRALLLLALLLQRRRARVAARGRTATPDVRQYHLYRDLRTYGRNELMLNESRQRGSLYLKFADDDPPDVARDGRRADRDRARPADRRRGADDPRRPRRARDRDGPAARTTTWSAC